MTSLHAEKASDFRRAAVKHLDDVVQLAIDIAGIPAPTGEEHARAHFVAEWLKNEAPPRCDDVKTDAMGNVVTRIAGHTSGPPVLLAAHLDTVFPSGTELNIHRQDDRVHGPGIGDNCLGTASLLFLPQLFQAMDIIPGVDVILAAPVGEEGLGNLRGMRAVMERHQHVGAAIAIEGHNVGRITTKAVGSRRFRVVVGGPGGHSWGDYGRESAIHILGKIIAALAEVPVPRDPKTTFNVGHVEGGISINTIAPSASMLVDLRSIDAGELRIITERMEDVIHQHSRPNAPVKIEVLGERPAGTVSETDPIVVYAQQALRSLGIVPTLDASSTDANVPISMGIPAICLGLTTGGNVHRPDEYIDVEPLANGLAQLAMVTADIADHLATVS